jgi:2-keto-4-pentenoate hydratase/2-oxohepta-3-ene-1,7-dioic acid hydratase in catechol pathway
VGTLYGIGRNYAAHAREMGAEVPEDPIIFIKPPAAYRPTESVIELPGWSTSIHHEVELVVIIGADAVDIEPQHAWSVVAGVGIGLDLTARDVQAAAKAAGHPWAVAKAWRGSAPVGPIVPIASAGHGPWDVECRVNGMVRQHASTAAMERSIPTLISYLSRIFTLRAGDAIFTGTPEGVGPVVAGDVATCSLSSITSLSVTFA